MIATLKSDHDINKTLQTIGKVAWITAGTLFACYMYFVGAITFSVIKEQGLHENIKSLVSDMSQQELSFLNAEKNFSENYAIELGFTKVQTLSYAETRQAFAWNVGR